MHIITVSHPHKGDVVAFKLSLKKSLAYFALAAVLFIFVSGYLTYKILDWRQHHQAWHQLANWELDVDDQFQLQNFKQKTEHELTLISEHIGKLSAHLTRLNALGEKLTQQANLDPDEFNFNETPGMGGPQLGSGDITTSELLSTLSHFELLFNKRYHQLSFLEDFFDKRDHKKSSALWGSGKPVKKGWVSSYFGRRIDPFTGKKSWHNGVDIAGRVGEPVHAVASGVVCMAEDRGSYGQLIEIKHGDGLSTRYAHNKQVLVKPGDLVKKGDQIATVGSTGRSTGPHVHLEVRHHGKSVDPGLYFSDLKRKSA